ncbi:2-succinyl-6-hydroxy-2,4-cyclohexadiene-1-carboxylate synthase [Prosthecochloris sp. GSB1]|uniref:2-succinyl-6-hydroxy-2, 4-cyclohexadiene-1-carboxylate synthase n=1 Tax=Prosthecochloris sp. GSB1 TaxID=281093 RepID=UPI000B8D0206|nr:2-succinyl-6-hydroxy-2,4-cyclohexadiene-1-carboxylate synthase [Prosthecochloris sp. GSB1]ASQ91199.1 2-succinyl-6-hydroxy-2,4-cyclohexadiene-1-carboxylate synthase [Prosthecochloris sp. GSB1]
MRIATTHYDMHVSIKGNRDQPSLLLLHGFLGSAEDWLDCARTLGESRRCIMPDLPGHGKTSPLSREQPSFEEISRQLADIVRELCPDPCDLAGYSMGGRLALHLALHHSDLFRSAVIVSASPGLPTAAEREQRRQADRKVAESITADFEAFLEKWYRLPLFEQLAQHPLFPEMLERRRKNAPLALASALDALGTGNQPSLWDRLGANRLPLRFFAGEKDTKYVEIGRQLVNLCPCSELVVFTGCGHAPHIENRPLFLERLAGFIDAGE